MFKKFSLLLASLVLIGCSAPTAPSSSTDISNVETSTEQANTLDVTVVLKIKGEPSKEKKLTIEEGASALDALKQAFDTKEKDGFVTQIETYENDDATQTYWLYEVNGEMAEVGADEYLLNQHDTVTWIYDTL